LGPPHEGEITSAVATSALVEVLKRNAPAIITAVVSPKAVIVFVIIKIRIRKYSFVQRAR
jgi:hypothetical protein